ncbi:hypothetical protein D3C87_1415020 [compost metagenome]
MSCNLSELLMENDALHILPRSPSASSRVGITRRQGVERLNCAAWILLFALVVNVTSPPRPMLSAPPCLRLIGSHYLPQLVSLTRMSVMRTDKVLAKLKVAEQRRTCIDSHARLVCIDVIQRNR